MTTADIKVSVVICAYTQDRWIDLQRAIQSVQAQTIPPSEIIVVIDHNSSLHSLTQQTFPQLKVIENQDERGLSGARNTGIAHSSGQVIAFMDEDAEADRNWLESLIGEYQNPRVFGVGGAVIPKWELTPPNWLPEEFNWVVGCSYKGLPLTLAPVRNPIGCNMSFRRDTLIGSGGFRNGVGRIGTLPVGCEETELTIRARQLNPTSIYLYVPNARVYHKVPLWRMKLQYFVQRCYAEGLSKAQVTHFVGSNAGLSSERQYVMKILPQGVFNGFRQALLQRNSSGLSRSLAIIGGLFLTTAGYLAGSIKRLRSRHLEGGLDFKLQSQAKES